MDCAAYGKNFASILALLLLVTDPANAARPWQDAGDKPGNSGKGRNEAPWIGGTAPRDAEVDKFYAFQPTATDADGDTLVFSIVNKPAWAAFDSAHGYLSGYPSEEDAGVETTGIIVSVSDGKKTASLEPFSISVSAAVDLPPVISGAPDPEAITGQVYSFTPTATDPEGEALSFEVTNRPAWASFNASTGKLRGTPDAADVGLYEDIRIAASDGTSTSSMKPFSIAVVETTTGSVTLNWAPPTQNVDGSPLLDLAGFTIYYGTSERQYDHALEISNPGVTSAVIENLSVGTWYFAATATRSTGLESDPSAEVVRVVN